MNNFDVFHKVSVQEAVLQRHDELYIFYMYI